MDLVPDNVTEIFMDCLYKEGENTEGYILGEGIQNNIGFHPERLEKHKDDVRSILLELPDEFMKSGGGGWSFLNACNRRDGTQWTGVHKTMEQLFSLGNALGISSFQLPRELWDSLPGGMPYVVVDDTQPDPE